MDCDIKFVVCVFLAADAPYYYRKCNTFLQIHIFSVNSVRLHYHVKNLRLRFMGFKLDSDVTVYEAKLQRYVVCSRALMPHVCQNTRSMSSLPLCDMLPPLFCPARHLQGENAKHRPGLPGAVGHPSL